MFNRVKKAANSNVQSSSYLKVMHVNAPNLKRPFFPLFITQTASFFSRSRNRLKITDKITCSIVLIDAPILNAIILILSKSELAVSQSHFEKFQTKQKIMHTILRFLLMFSFVLFTLPKEKKGHRIELDLRSRTSFRTQLQWE